MGECLSCGAEGTLCPGCGGCYECQADLGLKDCEECVDWLGLT